MTKSNGIYTPSRRRVIKGAGALAAGMAAPALIGLFTFRFAPIVIAAIGSFYGTTLRGESIFLGLRNYTELFEDPAFWSTIRPCLF